MSFLYADSSAIIRAYFVDEPDHAQLRALLLEGDDAVVTRFSPDQDGRRLRQ